MKQENKDLMMFEKENFKVKVRETKDGILEFKIDEIAKSLGFSRIAKSGNMTIRWERVNKYLNELSYPNVGTGDFIPEQYVYLLGMKASNDIAINFQKWLAFDVIPSIRKHGGYIGENATEEQVDKITKYSLPKLKSTFKNENIEQIHNLYNDIKDFYKLKNTNFRLKMMDKIEQGLEDRIDGYKESKQMALITLCDDLIKMIKEDRDKLRQKISGGQKSHKTKLINKLQPKDEDYMILNCHGISNNYLYTTKYDKWTGDKIVCKTKTYENWIKYFPIHQLKTKENLNINWDKPITMFLKFDCMDKFDTENFAKAIIDQVITRFYKEDDNIVQKVVVEKNKSVKNYKDGKIYICIKNS